MVSLPPTKVRGSRFYRVRLWHDLEGYAAIAHAASAARRLNNFARRVVVPRKPRRQELGLSVEDYDRLLAAQGGGCAICGNPPKTRRLHVDHDHKTGRVRGLLCHRCNRALPDWVTAAWLRRAAWYLEGRIFHDRVAV